MEICVGSYDNYVVGLRVQKEIDGEQESFRLVTNFTDNSHMGCVKDVQISPHGRILASASSDETIHLFNLKTRRDMGSLFLHDGTISCVRFSGRSTLYSASDDGTIAVWNTSTWQCIDRLKVHKAGVNCMAIHPTAKLALSGGKDKQIVSWDLTTNKSCFTKNIGKVPISVEWSSDGTYFAVVTRTGVDLYETASARIVASLTLSEVVNSLAFIADNTFVVAGELGEVQVFHIVQTTAKLEKKSAPVSTINSSSNDVEQCVEGDTTDFKKKDLKEDPTVDPPTECILRKCAFVKERERIRSICSCTTQLEPNMPVTTFICAALSNGFVKVWSMPSAAVDAEVSESLTLCARYNLACRLTCITARRLSDNDATVDSDAEIVGVLTDLQQQAKRLLDEVNAEGTSIANKLIRNTATRTASVRGANLPKPDKLRKVGSEQHINVLSEHKTVSVKSLKRRQSSTPEEIIDKKPLTKRNARHEKNISSVQLGKGDTCTKPPRNDVTGPAEKKLKR